MNRKEILTASLSKTTRTVSVKLPLVSWEMVDRRLQLTDARVLAEHIGELLEGEALAYALHQNGLIDQCTPEFRREYDRLIQRIRSGK